MGRATAIDEGSMNNLRQLGKLILHRNMKSHDLAKLFPSGTIGLGPASREPVSPVVAPARNRKRRRHVGVAANPDLERPMRKTLSLIIVAGALVALGACSTTTEQKAGAGAVAGAVVGGPVGAAVGGAAGAVAGHVQDESSKPHS